MERSSSQRDLRVERLSKTPYSRPEPSRLRKSASMTPLATLKSIVNYVSSPFTKSSSTVLPTHSNDLDITITDVDYDQKSESGSEDEWNGEAPNSMNGQDIFSLAAAAGRNGNDFEERAASWRARGEIPGGRRQLARLGIQGSHDITNDFEPPTPTAPGHFNFLKSSPSMPILSTKTQSSSLSIPQPVSSTSTKRSRSPLSTENHSTLPSRTPIPTFAPPPPATSTPESKGLSSSASSVALSAFLEAKKGQQMTNEDFKVIESLTENMKAESNVGSPPKSDSKKYGGWAAGSYSGIKSSNSFSNLVTPAKNNNTRTNQAETPGTVFSIGTNSNFINQNSSPYRQRYLGPGMSPRRMFPQPKKSNLKPLFNFGASEEEDNSSKGKKRKVDEEEVMDLDETASSTSFSNLVPSKGLSSSMSLPSLSTLAKSSDKGKNKYVPPSHTPARPSPLSQNNSSPGRSTPVDEKAKRKAEAEAAGKKRAAEIIMDIIDEEIGPVIPTRKAEPVIFNPYDRTSLNPSSVPAVPPTQPSTAFAGSTPRKSILKNSTNSPVRRTPTRGAAAKLELHKEAMKGSKPLTTIERIQGVKPWEKGGSSSKSSTRVVTPTPDEDMLEIDELVDASQASSKAPSPAPTSFTSFNAPISPKKAASAFESSSSKLPVVEAFKPFNPPSITFNSQPLPESRPLPSIGSFDSPTRDSIIESSRSNDKPIPKPTFTFNKPSSTLESETFNEQKELSTVSSSNKESNRLDLNNIYLSAKDSALKITKPALPFFTFTLPPRPLEFKPSKEILEAAKKRDQPTFTFNLTSASTTQEVAKEWTCAMCMLKNPASATEKCTICEEPKPKDKPTAPPSNSKFSFGSSSTSTGAGGDQWTCNTCMLKNPATATEKCTICDAPKPKASTSNTSSQTSQTGTGFGVFGGFANLTQAKSVDSQWECSLCGLKNPESAKKECNICANPRS